ncbi:MAG: hypothetical protein EZS28_048870, partial [Streblomastix strix]
AFVLHYTQNYIYGAPVLVPAGNTHSRIYPPVPLLYVLDNFESIVVVSPLAHRISEANPPVLMNLVAVTLPSQQLTYDGNVTATKFIKSGGTASEVLCANGDTTTIDNPISRTYSSGTGGYIRLCVFPAANSTGAPYIQFQVSCNTNAMQTIDLVPNYTVNGISALYGVFTAPSYVQDIYNVYYGVDQLIHTHTGTGSTAIYTAWIHMMSASGSVTITVSKQSTYWTTRVTEILTQDIVSSITGTQTKIPMSFNLGNGGIIGCATTAINTTKAGQWEISKTNDNSLTINPSSLRQVDHN